jgi:hypothetical protein
MNCLSEPLRRQTINLLNEVLSPRQKTLLPHGGDAQIVTCGRPGLNGPFVASD